MLAGARGASFLEDRELHSVRKKHTTARPQLQTADLSAAPTSNAETLWEPGCGPGTAGDPVAMLERSGTQPSLIDRHAMFDAIKPSASLLDDLDTRQMEAQLLAPPEELAETLPPPPFVLLSSSPPPLQRALPDQGHEGGDDTRAPTPRVSGVRAVLNNDAPALLPLRDKLRDRELLRAQWLVRSTVLASLLGTILLQISAPGFDLRHSLATAAGVTVLGAALWLEGLGTFYGGLRRRHHVALGVVALTAILVVLAHTGMSSPTALLAVLLARHFAGGGRRTAALAFTSYASGGMLAIGVLSAVGILKPTGHFVSDGAATLAWSASLAVLAALAAAHAWHRGRHVAQVIERAQVRVDRREALLDEAYATIGSLRAPQAGSRTGCRLGRYQLGELIGRSHQTQVYAARSDAGQYAAIKFFPPGVSSERITRIFSRASAASTVCAGAVRVYEMGRLDDGGFFIVMQLLTGGDLATQLREPGSMSNTESLLLIDELADALACAHEGKVFHGNIKPENILQDANGRWHLADFDTPATALNQSIAAPRYTAPEAGSFPVDAAMDVFSLAAVAYRLLLRCPPLCDSDPFAVGGLPRPVRPSALAPVHSDVDVLFALALATDPRVRMDSPRAFADALRPAIDGRLPDWQRARALQVLRDDPYAAPNADAPLVAVAHGGFG